MNSSRSKPEKRASFGSVYFAAQGIAGLLWWFAIKSDIKIANMFFAAESAGHDMAVLMLPDLVWFVVGSLVVAALLYQGSKFVGVVATMLVGAIGYATLLAFGLVLDGGSWLSAVTMSGSFIGTIVFSLPSIRTLISGSK